MIKGIKIEVKVTADNVEEFDRALKLLGEDQVLVGVPEERAGRKEKGPITNAALAYIHDNGSPSQNIPPRPFLEPGIRSVQDRLTEQLKTTGNDVLASGERVVLVRGLHRVGAIARDGIRNLINLGNFVPLKPATIAARRRRGFLTTKPLVVTGQLRNSIDYVLKENV